MLRHTTGQHLNTPLTDKQIHASPSLLSSSPSCLDQELSNRARRHRQSFPSHPDYQYRGLHLPYVVLPVLGWRDVGDNTTNLILLCSEDIFLFQKFRAVANRPPSKPGKPASTQSHYRHRTPVPRRPRKTLVEDTQATIFQGRQAARGGRSLIRAWGERGKSQKKKVPSALELFVAGDG